MKLSASVLGGLLVLATAGCVSGTKAFPIAAHRSGCKADKIELVKQEGKDVVLSVCGVYEDWRWHPLAGWQYVGPSATQPLKQTMDKDADGVPDDVDACPSAAGVSALDPKKNGCPTGSDSDRDGIADAEDNCPADVGIMQPGKKNGCPPDADGDGIADNKDSCPDKAGAASQEATKNGCPAEAAPEPPPPPPAEPADKDTDSVPDDKDACPEQAGQPNEDAAKNGCPSAP